MMEEIDLKISLFALMRPNFKGIPNSKNYSSAGIISRN
jgi:hypothetical protein